jgi:hypothetical protein
MQSPQLISRIFVFGFEPAIFDMRNPMDSWTRGDSLFNEDSPYAKNIDGLPAPWPPHMKVPEFPKLGINDLDLMRRLTWNGEEHRKFLREIEVWVTLNLPRFIWQEIDTYKVDTTRMSCSTMHRLGKIPLLSGNFANLEVLDEVITRINQLAAQPRTDEILHRMKCNLPEGFYQQAGFHFNYETAHAMFLQRRKHRMPEWRFTGEHNHSSICDFLYQLPYMPQLLEDFLDMTRLTSAETKTLRFMLTKFTGESLTLDEHILAEKLKARP